MEDHPIALLASTCRQLWHPTSIHPICIVQKHKLQTKNLNWYFSIVALIFHLMGRKVHLCCVKVIHAAFQESCWHCGDKRCTGSSEAKQVILYLQLLWELPVQDCILQYLHLRTCSNLNEQPAQMHRTKLGAWKMVYQLVQSSLMHIFPLFKSASDRSFHYNRASAHDKWK